MKQVSNYIGYHNVFNLTGFGCMNILDFLADILNRFKIRQRVPWLPRRRVFPLPSLRRVRSRPDNRRRCGAASVARKGAGTRELWPPVRLTGRAQTQPADWKAPRPQKCGAWPPKPVLPIRSTAFPARALGLPWVIGADRSFHTKCC